LDAGEEILMTASVIALRRRFFVQGVEDAPSHGLLVEGASFEDAALFYLGDSHPEGSDGEVSVFVEDCETGEQQYFRIDLENGQAGQFDQAQEPRRRLLAQSGRRR
jgi:hypothetical protein